MRSRPAAESNCRRVISGVAVGIGKLDRPLLRATPELLAAGFRRTCFSREVKFSASTRDPAVSCLKGSRTPPVASLMSMPGGKTRYACSIAQQIGRCTPLCIAVSTLIAPPSMLGAVANPQPSAPAGSSWQLVFISLAILIFLLEIIHGWRLGLIRQLVRVIAIIVAYSCGFFAAGATVPLLRPHLKFPDPILAAVGGAILAFIVFTAINATGAALFKKTGQQSSRVIRFTWGITGALLGIPLGAFTLWLTFTGIRMIGSVAQAQLHNASSSILRPDRIANSATSASPANPLMAMLADMKSSLEGGRIGEVVCAADPIPPPVYRRLEKAGEVASNPEYAERFLSFPGAREITEHPRIVALRNDRQVMQLIASGQVFELLKNQRVVDALNDPSLQTRIKNFDLERALDYALQKNGGVNR